MKNLTDLEICKRIAEIEDKEIVSENASSVNVKDHNPLLCMPTVYQYNPLVDDALCFQLMVKYEVELDFTHYAAGIGLSRLDGGECIIAEKNPSRAICLAIIESMEQANENQN